METGLVNASAAARDLEMRLEALRAAAAFRNYERARTRVLEMQAQAARFAPAPPGAPRTEQFADVEFMLDASPLVIDKLRHHTHHVTGLSAYEYRSRDTRPRELFADRLRAMIQQGRPELLVAESPLLGGFGFEIDGQLFNLETLKFFKVLIALDRGAVLQEFRTNDRRLVWEIGAGWGGFPYQFKSLCPNVTYAISDRPELFLFSATYLMTTFPDAKVGFWGEDPSQAIGANWRDYDFIFVPHFALDQWRPDRLDLTINVASFDEMTQEQVTGYVTHAHAAGCPFFYSLNRDRAPYNQQLESVTAIVSRFYWPREISTLHVPCTKMLDCDPLPDGYKHVLGWRRVKI